MNSNIYIYVLMLIYIYICACISDNADGILKGLPDCLILSYFDPLRLKICIICICFNHFTTCNLTIDSMIVSIMVL